MTLSTISEFSGVLMVSGLGGIAILGGASCLPALLTFYTPHPGSLGPWT